MVQQYGIPPCVYLRCLATIHKLDVVCTQSCSSPRMVLRYLTSVLERYHIAAVLHASSVALANGVPGIALRWRSWCVVLKAIMYQCLVHPQCRRAALHWCVMAGVGGSNNDCHTGQVVRTQACSRVIGRGNEMHVRQLMLMCACNVQHTLRITEQRHGTIPGHAYDGLVNKGQLSMSQGWMQGR